MLSLEKKIISIYGLKSHGLFENVMVETGVEANGMVEITSKWIVQKKSLAMPLTVNTFRKGSDPWG
jgi:Cu(I)/Ag(I) efflux system membrane fusion protein